MTEQEYRYILYRQRKLPEQITATRIKLSNLLCEADRIAMTADILKHEFQGDLIAMERARMRNMPVAGLTAGLI